MAAYFFGRRGVEDDAARDRERHGGEHVGEVHRVIVVLLVFTCPAAALRRRLPHL
jgi:hypothetical protein